LTSSNQTCLTVVETAGEHEPTSWRSHSHATDVSVINIIKCRSVKHLQLWYFTNLSSSDL